MYVSHVLSSLAQATPALDPSECQIKLSELQPQMASMASMVSRGELRPQMVVDMVLAMVTTGGVKGKPLPPLDHPNKQGLSQHGASLQMAPHWKMQHKAEHRHRMGLPGHI